MGHVSFLISIVSVVSPCVSIDAGSISQPNTRKGMKRICAKFPDLRTDEHDKQRGWTAGNLPSGHKNPEELWLPPTTTANDVKTKMPSDSNHTEKSWICACN